MGDVHARDIDTAHDFIAGNQSITNVINKANTNAEEAKAKNDYERELLARGIADVGKGLKQRINENSNSPEPYIDLRSYSLGNRSIFYGRGEALKSLLPSLENPDMCSSLKIIQGMSGIGKTSLIRAGLSYDLLVKGHLPIYVRALNEHPTQALKRQLAPSLEVSSSFAQMGLKAFLREVIKILGNTNLIVFFDQFEEFFSSEVSLEIRKDFIDQLRQCLEDDTIPVRFVVSIQTEYFGQMSVFQPAISNPFADSYYLKPFTAEEARLAIIEPAKKKNIQYQPVLIERLLKDLQLHQELETPQLQLLCSTLYDECSKQGRKIITEQMYSDLGGFEGILLSYLRRIVEDEIGEHSQTAKLILGTLITSTGGLDHLSSQTIAARLSGDNIGASAIDDILKKLKAKHILRQSRSGEYQLMHQYLVAQIQDWIDPEQVKASLIYELLRGARKQREQLGSELDPKLLDLIQDQISNPFLRLGDEDYQLILVSALHYGSSIKVWKEHIGEQVFEWLREIPFDTTLRLPSIIALAEFGDQIILRELQEAVKTSSESSHIEMLARFMYHYPHRVTRSMPWNSWIKSQYALQQLQLVAYKPTSLAIRDGIAFASATATFFAVALSYLANYDQGGIWSPRSFGVIILLFPFIAFAIGNLYGHFLMNVFARFVRQRSLFRVGVVGTVSALLGVAGFYTILFTANGWIPGAAMGIALVSHIIPAKQWMNNRQLNFLLALIVILACASALFAVLSPAKYRDIVHQVDIPGLVGLVFFALIFIRTTFLVPPFAARHIINN